MLSPIYRDTTQLDWGFTIPQQADFCCYVGCGCHRLL